MKTLYAACLSRLGLSQTEAARLHDVRIDTVKSWSSGRNRVPQGAWDDLRSYNDQIADAADEFLSEWHNAGCPPISIHAADGEGAALMAVADFLLSTDSEINISTKR